MGQSRGAFYSCGLETYSLLWGNNESGVAYKNHQVAALDMRMGVCWEETSWLESTQERF